MLTLPSIPSDRKLLILGEAPGEEEVRAGAPFIGPSGKFLHSLFHDAGLDIREWHIANVLTERPENNLLLNVTITKTEAKKQGMVLKGSPLGKRFLLPDWQGQADATLQWIKETGFDFILCLGGTALWLLTGDNRIGLFRGNLFRFGNATAIASFHPAAVLREFSFRPICWSDFRKIARHLDGSLAPAIRRTFIYSPSWDEMAQAFEHFSRDRHAPLGVDIETAPSIAQITTISFAWPDFAICIPIWDKSGTVAGHNVYPDPADEVKAWRWIERFSNLPNPKVLQNGLYDIQYLLEAPVPIRLKNATEDTNILSHALEPELPKDLGMLASTRLNEPGWKQMRTKHQDEKAED